MDVLAEGIEPWVGPDNIAYKAGTPEFDKQRRMLVPANDIEYWRGALLYCKGDLEFWASCGMPLWGATEEVCGT